MSNLSSIDKQKIKSKVERSRCSVHGKSPEVKFTFNDISVSCCCEPFRKKTISAVSEAMAEVVRDQIDKAFKKMF